MTPAIWIESEVREVQVYAAICGVPGPSKRLQWSSHNNKKGGGHTESP